MPNRYIDAYESPLVGAYFDVGNIVKYGWPEQWIRTLGKRIVKLDIKGYSRTKGWCAIGDGDAGWPDVRKALDDIGFEGWATAEVAGGDKERLRDMSPAQRSEALKRFRERSNRQRDTK